jgi:hypothetical protein
MEKSSSPWKDWGYINLFASVFDFTYAGACLQKGQVLWGVWFMVLGVWCLSTVVKKL